MIYHLCHLFFGSASNRQNEIALNHGVPCSFSETVYTEIFTWDIKVIPKTTRSLLVVKKKF